MNTYFKIGSNQRERNSAFKADDGTAERVDILYSYETPVAMYDKRDGRLYVTRQFHSATTSRHINKWVQQSHFHGLERRAIPQASLDTIHHKVNLWEAQKAGVSV